MRAVSRNWQSLLTMPRYSFSGFGRDEFIQLAPTIPTSTRTTLSPATTPPINKSTTS